jgi:hypothetical protein
MIAVEKQRAASITEPKPNPAGQNAHRKPELDEVSETEFLVREAENAKAAIWLGWHKLKDDLGDAADVRMWTKEHPWVALSVAATAGFAVASAIIGDFHESKEKNKPSSSQPTGTGDFAELFRILRSEKVSGESTYKINRNPDTISRALTWLGTLIVEFLKLSVRKAVNQALHPSDPLSTVSTLHDIRASENGKPTSPEASQGLK